MNPVAAYVLAGIFGIGVYLAVAVIALWLGAPGAIPAIAGLVAWLPATLWALVELADA